MEESLNESREEFLYKFLKYLILGIVLETQKSLTQLLQVIRAEFQVEISENSEYFFSGWLKGNMVELIQ